MVKLLVVYVHLLATCMAVGAILATDLRLLTRLRGKEFRLSPPGNFLSGLVASSLAVLCVTGGVLVLLSIAERPDYLANPKLQAKLMLVGLLVLNGIVLHVGTFPWLRTRQPLDAASPRVWLGVAAPIALSNSLWLYVAFLGVARPWNFTVPAGTVLAVGACVTLLAWATIVLMLRGVARRQREQALRRKARKTARQSPTAAHPVVDRLTPADTSALTIQDDYCALVT